MTLTRELINRKYPIAMSTGTDPFCKPNIKTTETILQYMKLNGNGLLAYTKGGDIDAILGLCEGLESKTILNIGITTLDDDISKRIEPNAPLPKERIELARKAKQKGIKVILQINPYAKYWMPDNSIQEFINICKDIDIKDVSLSTLFLYSKIWGSDKYEFDKKEYGGNNHDRDVELHEVHRKLRMDDINSLLINFPVSTKVKSIYYDAFGDKLFPTINCQFNYIEKMYNEHNISEFSFDDIFNGITTQETREVFDFPIKKSWIWSIIREVLPAKNLQSEAANIKLKTIKDVMLYIWNNPKTTQSLQNSKCLDRIDNNDGTFNLKLNEQARYYMIINKKQ
jgi:DNA repair photolyase